MESYIQSAPVHPILLSNGHIVINVYMCTDAYNCLPALRGFIKTEDRRTHKHTNTQTNTHTYMRTLSTHIKFWLHGALSTRVPVFLFSQEWFSASFSLLAPSPIFPSHFSSHFFFLSTQIQDTFCRIFVVAKNIVAVQCKRIFQIPSWQNGLTTSLESMYVIKLRATHPLNLQPPPTTPSSDPSVLYHKRISFEDDFFDALLSLWCCHVSSSIHPAVQQKIRRWNNVHVEDDRERDIRQH